MHFLNYPFITSAIAHKPIVLRTHSFSLAMQNMKYLIDYIIAEKAQGNSFQELNYTMKLMLKGIPVKTITPHTNEDPIVLGKIYEAAKELNVSLPNVKN